jgi:peptide/nickel transport system substrate-binding protein
MTLAGVRRGLCALAAAAVLLGCSKVDATGRTAGGRHPWTIPGVLRMATNADPKNLDPVLAASAPTLELSAFMFSYTIRYDDRARPFPDAVREIPTVANGDVSRDGRTIRYKLRPNMKWHDGAPVTCADLRFTWQVVMNPHNNVVTTDGYKDIHDIDCRDPLVAVVHMKRLYAPFLQQLWSVNGNAPILPEHLLARYNDDAGSFNKAPYQSAPIGSGPFRFVSWTRGSEVVMKAFPGFYLGKPKLDRVVYKIMPDENTMATQLATHELDLVFHGTGSIYARLKATPGVTTVTPPVYLYTHLDFNMRRPIFADVRVRAALADAIDRPTILAKVGHGLGELSNADESPSIGQAYTNDVVKHPYDPARARALLDAAGWHIGRDGVRVRGRTRFAFTITAANESTTMKQVEEVVLSYWRAIGADVTVKNAPTPLFFDNTANGILQGGRYDVAAFAWFAAVDPDDSAIYSSENFAPHGQNALFWNDPIATHAMNDALATIDWPRRVADYHVVQQRLASQVPTIILWFQHEPEAYNDDLKGFTVTPVITTPFWDPWNYSI